jgi:hypothetical protein
MRVGRSRSDQAGVRICRALHPRWSVRRRRPGAHCELLGATGGFHATKECSQYNGAANSFCTITGSNLPQIGAGSKVIYLQAAGASGLDIRVDKKANLWHWDGMYRLVAATTDRRVLHQSERGFRNAWRVSSVREWIPSFE